MAITKPLKRTCRQFKDGEYSNSGQWQYLLHKDYAQDPQHYIRGFMIIQQDLINLFQYVEPCDQNMKTVSFRIHELLMRTCIEVEANFTAILRENIYAKNPDKLTMDDYRLVNLTHRLSSYEIKLPIWKGSQNVFSSFKAWEKVKDGLTWYQAYNKAKHDRHQHFEEATFENLIYAICGLIALLSSQFYNEDYSPDDKSMSIGGSYSYGWEAGWDIAIGGYFKVKFPKDWPEEQRYAFNWADLEKAPDPTNQIDYNALEKDLGKKSKKSR